MPNIDTETYVPVLRWKAAERGALSRLDTGIRKCVAPVFEFIMPAPKRDRNRKVIRESRDIFLDQLNSFSSEIDKCTSNGSVFIDVHLVDGSLRANALESILDSGRDLNVEMIPVTHIFPVSSSMADMMTREVAVRRATLDGTGLCVRIDRVNLEKQDLASEVKRFVSSNNLKLNDMDILVDLGIVTAMDSADEILEKLAELSEIGDWRRFIVSGGAFPKDLTTFEKHSQVQLPRFEWNLAKALSKTNRLGRPIIYSDYTIQHPVFYENLPFPNVSASVRYTDDACWQVLRGEGLNNEKGAGHLQYIAHAQLIIRQRFFKGANFSFGDDYIIERAQPQNELPGNPMTWLRAGINHHITLVVKQLSSNRANKASA